MISAPVPSAAVIHPVLPPKTAVHEIAGGSGLGDVDEFRRLA